MNRRYRAFGLVIESDIALPALAVEAGDQAADIHIRQAGIPQAPTVLAGGGATAHGPYFLADAGAAWFSLPDVGRYHMAAGREIRYQPVSGGSADEQRLYLLGTCLSLLLFQRGLLVLHGNAIRVGASAVICAGASGVGKSTLAAAFMARGYPVLADDTCVLDAEGRVLPGIARIKLWQDSADRLGVDTTGLARIRPDLDKFELPLGAAFHAEPLALSHVYALKRPDGRSELGLTRCTGAASLRPLRAHTYRIGFVDAMGLKAWHLGRVGQLASRVRVAKLHRPAAGFEPDALVDFILADMAGNLAPGAATPA